MSGPFFHDHWPLSVFNPTMTLMKYFSRAWASGEIDPEEAEKIRRAYWDHVDRLLPRCSEEVAELAISVNLHDAILRHVFVDREAEKLRIELICGDLQAGYRDIDLSYSGLPRDEPMLAILKERARDRQSAILYDEVDMDEQDRFVHRILFWPEGEIAIGFTTVAIRQTSREDRVVPTPDDVFSDGPINA